MTLEDRITGGLVSYIKLIRHDEANATFSIEFVRDPEDQVVDRILRFSEVCELHQKIDDEEVDDLLEQLIGLDEREESGRTRYFVVTDAREVDFYCEAQPVIERIPQ